MEVRMNGQMKYGWMDRQMAAWMNGWTDDEYMDRQID